MKKFLNLFIILLTFQTGLMAQKGFNLEKEITINVPAEVLWEMVGPGFVEVYKWSSNVDHAEGAGTSAFEGAVCDERYCDVNVKGFSKISEKLTNYSDQKMTLTYQVFQGMPKFINQAENKWSIVSIDSNHSKLVMAAEFSLNGIMGSMMKGIMKKKMDDTLTTVLVDAKVFAETGQVSTNKAKRIEKLREKQAS